MGLSRHPSSAPPLDPPVVASPAVAPSAAWTLGDDQRVPLRLTVTRGVLGMELYEPVALGPLDITRMALTLPNLRFPLDLSGGVPQFRHRRGELQHATLSTNFQRLARFFEGRVAKLIGPLARPLTLFSRPHGVGVGMVSARAALAFDLLWVPDERDARFVVHDARGVGLRATPLCFALRALDAGFSGVGTREGRVLTIRDAGSTLGRSLLPAVGARAPSARRVRFGPLASRDDELSLELDATFSPLELSPGGVRALEFARLVRSADDALSRGDTDSARAGYLLGLESAPRHPELVRLLADLDLETPDRAEAALGLLVESMPATRAGLTGAELLWRLGDFEGAREAVTEAVRHESYAPLAALTWCRAGERETSPVERRVALDHAVALSPGLELPRERRFASRLQMGDSLGALSDVEHLEAMTPGASGKHDKNLRAARAFAAAGFGREARRCFERALRYVPDDAGATAGLARALLEAGRRERAATLLTRAVALAERSGQPDPDALIDLALVLGRDLQDLPQAIARLRQVPWASARAVEARRLEASFRASLGDIAGASLAYGRMREAIELGAEAAPGAANYLLEAAEFEYTTERDVLAAERHLAVAVRIAPRDTTVSERYRAMAAEVVAMQRRRQHED